MQNISPDISPWTIIDVQDEQYREYTYPGGEKFRITAPAYVYVLANGSHRVVDFNGVTHRPQRGFVGISWKPKNGAPPFNS